MIDAGERGHTLPARSSAVAFADDLRLPIMHVVGGGTNDVQRNLVARTLGLGR